MPRRDFDITAIKVHMNNEIQLKRKQNYIKNVLTIRKWNITITSKLSSSIRSMLTFFLYNYFYFLAKSLVKQKPIFFFWVWVNRILIFPGELLGPFMRTCWNTELGRCWTRNDDNDPSNGGIKKALPIPSDEQGTTKRKALGFPTPTGWDVPVTKAALNQARDCSS